MAAGVDLFEIFGPPTDEQARRMVVLLRLGPGQRKPKPTDEKSKRSKAA
jgi:hypothetical protein